MIYELLQIQAGQVTTPREETGAAGDNPLDVPQRAHNIGEPVPIVFARRRNSKGGILISPSATEARFVNDTSNAVTASYHLILSEGQIDKIPVKDVFQRSCRTGTHAQTYNRRAGTWTPGNFIVDRAGYSTPVCPYYCGTTGAFPNISTMSFVSGSIPDGFDFWNRQVHVFVRGGMHVLRYEDNQTGPSDSFADLYRWMLSKSSKVPATLIDNDGLTVADKFLRANGFTCNCWITESYNLADWGTKWAPYFLLSTSSNNGKKGLRPVLPVTSTGAINLGVISPVYTFTEDTIIPGSFSVNYTSLTECQPFVAQMVWKQPLESDVGIVRTSEVRIHGTAYDGPFESHDLSEFCTTENHAVKVGAYIVAKRVYTTHTASFTAKPGTHNTLVAPGSIVRVQLVRETTDAEPGSHDYLYQVERVSKTLAGDVGYECTHFPINGTGQSVIALCVANTQATGILMSSNRTGVTCDVNSSSDNSQPPDTGTDIDWSTNDNPYGEPVEYPFVGGDSNVGPGGGGGDPFGPAVPPRGGGVSGGGSSGGGSSSASGEIRPAAGLEQCAAQTGGTTTWYADGEEVGQGQCYTPTDADVGKTLTSQYSNGDELTTEEYGIVQSSPLTGGYSYVRWSGQFESDKPGVSGPYISKWFYNALGTRLTIAAFDSPVSYIESSGQYGRWDSGGYLIFTADNSAFSGYPIYVYQLRDYDNKIIEYARMSQVTTSTDFGFLIAKVTGVWQFSNDKTNILNSWGGVYSFFAPAS